MRVLLDHCVPRGMRRFLPGHDVETTFRLGWAGLNNGELLAAAAKAGFDCLLTVDQNVRFQQNLSQLPMAVIVLAAPNNQLETLSPFVPYILKLLEQPLRRAMYIISQDGTVSNPR